MKRSGLRLTLLAYENALLTDVMTVQFVEMTEAEYKALPEFAGG